MVNWMKRLIGRPVLEDEEKTRIAGLLNAILLAILAFIVVYSLASLAVYPNPLPILRIAGVLVFLSLGALYLVRRGLVRFASVFLSSVLWGIVTFSMFAFAGMRAPSFSGYFVVILIAGLLVSGRAAMAFAGLSTVAGLAILYAENSGRLTPSPIAIAPATTWMLLTTSLIMAALLLYLFTRTSNDTLVSARRNRRDLFAKAAERERVETQVRRLSQFQESIIDNANVWLDVLDEKGNVVIWNKAAAEISGYSRKEVVGHDKIWEWLYPDKEYRNQIVARTIVRIEEGREERELETTIRCKDGQTRIISWYSRALMDEKKNPIGSVALGLDITERKQAEEEIKRLNESLERRVVERTKQLEKAVQDLKTEISERKRIEEALRASEERFALAVRGSNDGLWDWDVANNTLYWSPRLKEIFGYADDELEVGFDTFESHLYPEDKERTTAALEAHLKDRVSYDLEHRLCTRSGGYRWIRTRGQAIWDENGNPTRMVGASTDITERKQAEEEIKRLNESLERRVAERTKQLEKAVQDLKTEISERKRIEEALRASEERFALAVRGSNDGIYDHDIVNNTIYWSPRLKEIFGYADDELEVDFDTFESHLYPEDKERTKAAFEAHLKDRVPYDLEHRLRTKSGEYRWVRTRGQAIWDENGNPTRMVGATTDITERKQAEEEIKRLNESLERRVAERTKQLEKAVQDLKTEISERKRIEEALRVSEERFALAVRGTNDGLWDWDVANNTLYWSPRMKEIIGYADDELEVDFNMFESHLHPGDKERTEAAMEAHLKDRVPYDVEQRLRTKSGEYRWVRARGQAVWDEDGNPTRMVGASTDITALKKAETQLQRYAAKLECSNRELEEFAYVASHDLQEPLRKVQAFSERLENKYGGALGDQGRDYLGRMKNAATRMQTLINGLLTYSRITTRAQPFVPVNLTQMVHEVISDLEIRIEQVHGQVEAGDLPTIEADPTQMRQLLQNLLGNALKFYREDEAPIVKIYAQPLNDKTQPVIRKSSGDGRSSNNIKFIVEDNGIGFDEKYLDSIFQVFKRLHGRDKYEGSGVGLATCRKIVERHGGSITAKSAPGQGAAFIITLPVKQSGGEG